MSVRFIINKDGGYYKAELTGTITDEILIKSFEDFINGSKWYPGLNNITDLSNADMSQVSVYAMEKIAQLMKQTNIKHSFYPKVAIYAPKDLTYGLARVYLANSEQNELVNVFRDYKSVLNWVSNSKNYRKTNSLS